MAGIGLRDNGHQYDDILDLEHPTSKKHPRMPVADRAAQFAPFAALSGFEEAVRRTEKMHEESYLH